MPGPVPKRSSQRRRRNKPDGPPPKGGPGSSTEAWIAYAETLGVDVPDGASRSDVQALIAEGAKADEWHPLATEWFDSLSQSGQTVFYEPSDWATARIMAEILSRALSAGKLNASLIERWQTGATELLTTEGARRRLRVELDLAGDDENVDEEAVASVSSLDQFRRRASAGGAS